MEVFASVTGTTIVYKILYDNRVNRGTLYCFQALATALQQELTLEDVPSNQVAKANLPPLRGACTLMPAVLPGTIRKVELSEFGMQIVGTKFCLRCMIGKTCAFKQLAVIQVSYPRKYFLIHFVASMRLLQKLAVGMSEYGKLEVE